MSALPAEVATLVARFADNRNAYHSPAYNETQTRREFIDPFFKALGRDVDNTAGLAEAHKDVIHEHTIKVRGADRQIDQLVHQLYRLTDVKIEIVEERRGRNTPVARHGAPL